LFPHVGLGARFAVRCGAFPPQEGPGPTQAGEQAVFRFRLHAEARSLRGRALDGNGEPLRYRYIDLRIERADRSESARARTDGNGVFYCALPRRGREDAPMSCVQFHLLERLYYTGIMARVEPKAAADDQVVLGDVVLMPAPLLAAGTLADTEGLFITPTLELRAVDAEGAAAGPPLPAVSVRGPGDHFAIRGWTDAAKLELQVKDTDLLPAAPLRFDRGATDLRLVLQRHGSITATVQHDLPYEQANLLRTEVIADGDAQARRQSWSAGPAAPGRIRINLGALPAGRCTLQVRIAGDPQPLATIAGLEVGHGAARDPRLSALDVRGRVRLARMQVLDGAGAPVRGDGTLLIDDRAEGINWVKLHGGFFVVPVASQPVAATIRVPGFREQRVQGIDADRTVRLEPLLELHARLSPELALPSGVTLHAFARRRGAAANPFEEAMRKQRGPIAGSGQPPTAQTGQRFTFALANEGEFELTFVLARSGGARSVALPTAPAVVAVAASSATPDDVAFAVTDADLQSALRELLRE
jgi:hypothetical protein